MSTNLGTIFVKQSINYNERVLDQFTIQPPNIELLLPTRKGIIPRDAVWQTVHLKKY